MHKPKLKSISCLMAGLLTLISHSVPLYALSMEQAQVLLPEVSVYIHDEDSNLSTLTLDEISATLDGNPMTVESFELSEEGIYYCYMLDISNSTKESYLTAAKNAVLNTYEHLREQDELGLISFGESVNVLLNGGESEEQVYDAVNALTNNDTSTKFYDAMNRLVETAAGHSDMRRVAIAVSDGLDETPNGMTQEQVENVLKRNGISVYGMIFDYATEEECSAFRHLVELSGGQHYTYNPDNMQDVQNTLLSQVDQVYKLTLTANEQTTDNDVHILEVQLGNNEPITTEILLDKTAEDYEKPEVTEYTVNNDANNITVHFSKDMENLTDTGCYTFTSDTGTSAAAEIIDSTKDTVTLSGDIFASEEHWTLNIAGLQDTSVNHNKIRAVSLSLDDIVPDTALPADPEPQIEPAEDSSLTDLLLPIGGGAAILLLLLLLLLLRRRRTPAKKTNEKKEKYPKQDVQFYFSKDDKNKK